MKATNGYFVEELKFNFRHKKYLFTAICLSSETRKTGVRSLRNMTHFSLMCGTSCIHAGMIIRDIFT